MVRKVRNCFYWGTTVCAVAFLLVPQNALAGELQSIRDEVRNTPARSSDSSSLSSSSGSSPSSSSGGDSDSRNRKSWLIWSSDGTSDDSLSLSEGLELSIVGGYLAGCVVTSPFWGPRKVLSDDGTTGYFPKYPYRKGESFLMYQPMSCDWSQQPRRYSGRIRMEYCENYRDLWRVGGQIQLETASRFGIDTEAHRFEEWLGGERTDYLWLGDCNFIYRFAQSERAAFRAGIGFNWLSDQVRTDYGFNFTYGFDLYPRKPWVFSTELDIGTLGKSELFRVRTTAGVMIHRVETYIGYEYLDVAGTTFNGLITGLRVSF